jgi:hypothetical protein
MAFVVDQSICYQNNHRQIAKWLTNIVSDRDQGNESVQTFDLINACFITVMRKSDCFIKQLYSEPATILTGMTDAKLDKMRTSLIYRVKH